MFDMLDLHTLRKAGDAKLAKEYFRSTLRAAERRALRETFRSYSNPRQRRTIHAAASSNARRLGRASAGQLFKKPQGRDPLDEVLEVGRKGETSNLIGIYAMAQGVIAQDTNEMTPGNVIQASNLLTYVIEHMGAATLTEAYAMIADDASWGEIFAQLHEAAGYNALIKDSDKGFF